jgi:hypothetical protein
LSAIAINGIFLRKMGGLSIGVLHAGFTSAQAASPSGVCF